MKKLNLLKTIVDFIWIMSLIFLPLIIILSIMIIINKEIIDIPLTFATGTIDLTNGFGKIALVINVLNFSLLLYSLYFFRKLLTQFKKRMIFETEICFLLDKIGRLIILASIVQLFADFTGKLSYDKVGIEFGYGPFLYLLALGLFFKVLSEVFTIGRKMKEENELTI
ncbi:MAG: DUF2975 domain-containing protein [Flavobacterium sp.]|uniref:DUF2975 domain-containing protein n=1 Tax=Flavobacterium sp. TaxID=239 RepID=UPI003264A43E